MHGNSWKHTAVLVVTGWFILCGTNFPAIAATPFAHETVDATGWVGEYTSLALDTQGNPHISYADISSGDLNYAVKTGGIWAIETVDSTGLGLCTSLTLDAQGNPHISYWDLTNGDLNYAVKTGGIWAIETVDSTGNVGKYASLALDAWGNPHISYFDFTNEDLKYAVKTGGVWWIETVDSTGDVGYYTSIALDAWGNPHISYWDLTNDDLKYAVTTGSVWRIETVDAIGGGYTSIALDAQGYAHISYYEGTNQDLKYAFKSSLFSWTIETVDATGDVGESTSLALDVHGNPHISYSDNTNGDLKYAVKTGGSWSTEPVDAIGGDYTSIALDAQGNPCISYFDWTNHDLKYTDSAIHLTSPIGGEIWVRSEQAAVTWDGAGEVDISLSAEGGLNYAPLAIGVTGGSAIVDVPAVTSVEARVKIERSSPLSTSTSPEVFTIEPARLSPWWTSSVDATGDVGEYTSVTTDSWGNPHVSYYDATNSDLEYAVKMGGSWSTETVDATGDVGFHASLVLDAQDDPHISYYDGTNWDLKYAVKTGGSWSIETVDATGIVGEYTSLALDAQDNPHISYYDGISGDLKYAVRTGGWAIETVDATGIVGMHTSLALDAQGNPHIGYLDYTNSALKYAVKTGGSWAIETVTASVGLSISLALDAQGNPHTSYLDLTNGDLKYAVKTGGNWTIETVDAAGLVGGDVSIALDARGTPHISYRDFTNSDLKYAVKTGGGWTTETVDATGDVGEHTSLALDAQDNPHVSYYDVTNGDLKYASGAIALAGPIGGDTWPVGATRTVVWDGLGAVDISLSVDGGSSYETVATGVSGGSYHLIVPHTPSKFSLVRIERREEANDFGSYVYRHSISESDSFFTIETSVELLSMMVAPAKEGDGNLVTWKTDPGPEDLDGYRLEKKKGSDDWFALVSRTKETLYHDVDGVSGDRYRLFAINGLGEEFYMGEASDGEAPSFGGRLVAWPLPFRGGELNISFPTSHGGAPIHTEVVLYDVAGRRIKTLAEGVFQSAARQVKWDGRDDNGNLLASGIYFLRASSKVSQQTLKLVIVR